MSYEGTYSKTNEPKEKGVGQRKEKRKRPGKKARKEKVGVGLYGHTKVGVEKNQRKGGTKAGDKQASGCKKDEKCGGYTGYDIRNDENRKVTFAVFIITLLHLLI